MSDTAPTRTLLKRDLLGSVCRIDVMNPASGNRLHVGTACIERNTHDARWWLRRAARWLAAREARALQALGKVPGVPRLLDWDGGRLQRSWLDGRPMQDAQPRDPGYYREALRLIRRLHAAGVVHNDLAKEPNWLVAPDGSPAVVDFQLAMRPRYRGWRFRALAYDDLRHLLKHKRSYCPDSLTARQRAILARRSLPATLWMRSVKPAYHWVTRSLLGWSDREGAGDRGH
jgi:RIO-like serine/threonine protein kinase